uniref:Uncharacterized protein n=1 Tax=viral metagenome TaxID=1070528 RepID=A0A6M3L2E3_9ZZZZ
MNYAVAISVPTNEILDLLPSEYPNPEEIQIKKEAKERKGLSKEAKSVIMLVLNTPDELRRAVGFGARTKPVSKRMITAYLKSVGWHEITIRETYVELKEFVNGF